VNTKEFIKLANNKRLKNKNKWIFLNEYVNDLPITYKAFDTWVQIIKYKGLNDSSPMSLNVSEFKKYLLNTIEG